MSNHQLVILLRISIGLGISLLIVGVYLHFFDDNIDALGMTGIYITAGCYALGSLFSFPTKIYLTFLLMKMEAEAKEAQSDDI
ncbi:MAG: hypothetical protein GY928_26640 [Colwellia sp.]|nr:hypothetical protein [Colwellia sp.]